MNFAPVKHGHFVLESGLHTDTWLELEFAFVDQRAMEQRYGALELLLKPFDFTAVCGPLTGGALVAQTMAQRLGKNFYYTQRAIDGTGAGLYQAGYQLPEGLQASAARERFAVIDDAMSAGSSTRSTSAHLASLGAPTVVVGALWLLGDVGRQHFAASGIPVVAHERLSLGLWEPGVCPACARGVPLERRVTA